MSNSVTQKKRKEYKDIIERFNKQDNKVAIAKFVIVSNGSFEKTKRERLEYKYGIRVGEILHSEATTPIPDLKNRI